MYIHLYIQTTSRNSPGYAKAGASPEHEAATTTNNYMLIIL